MFIIRQGHTPHPPKKTAKNLKKKETEAPGLSVINLNIPF